MDERDLREQVKALPDDELRDIRRDLTTIALPHYEMGRQAVRLALGPARDGAPGRSPSPAA